MSIDQILTELAETASVQGIYGYRNGVAMISTSDGEDAIEKAKQQLEKL